MNFTKYNTSIDSALKYDQGLRAYMLNIFNYMALALVVSGIAAFFACTPEFQSIMMTRTANGPSISGLGWLIQLSPLFIVMFFSYKISSMAVSTAKLCFWTYSVLMGLSLGPLFLSYTGESIFRTFLITASAFGSMSIYGYTTKKDLTSFGSFLMMGIWGIFLASLINIFLHSNAISFAVSIIGVLVFTGLTAYNVQGLKQMYFQSSNIGSDDATKLSIHGALTLYINFINLFIMLLRFFGNRRD